MLKDTKHLSVRTRRELQSLLDSKIFILYISDFNYLHRPGIRERRCQICRDLR